MERGKISALQMAVLLYPAITATALLTVPGLTAEYAKNDLWLSPLLASSVGFAAILIAVWLHNMFPGETVIQYSEKILGRAFGKVLSFGMILFYLDTTGTLIRDYSEFIITFFFPRTPQIVIVGSIVLLCACCVYAGLEVLARCGQLLLPFFIIPLLMFIIFLARDFEPENIFPILSHGMIPPIKGAIVIAGWFSEFFLVAFLLPFLSDQKKQVKYGVLAVLAVTISLTIVNLIVLFILGPTTSDRIYPLMNVGRYANLGSFIGNMESVIMAVWIAGAFIKISVFYYAVSLGTAQWLNLSSYKLIVWPLGIIIVQLAFLNLDSSMELEHYVVRVFPFSSITVQILLPLCFLVIALIVKRKKKNESA